MSYKQVLKLFFAFIFFICLSSLALALEIPVPQAYVNDYANLFEASKRQDLEVQLKHFEDETSNQIMVATFPSLEGESLEDFSQRLAAKWKVGQKLKNNGVVLLVFSQDHKIRIEVGYGLEGALPDALAKRIIQNEIAPYFKNRDFSSGIVAGVQAIEAATRGEYKGRGPRSSSSRRMPSLGTIIFLIILFSIFTRRGRGITFFPGGWGYGGGGSSGNSDNDSFSGGGGGDFGGGGASGDW
ncbi:MAG: TPM domain-containing protein [Deltaproteobacteria bacterium]|nr:TPM domain-containing protein [Deltaproteobacteria bacterium]